MSMFTWVYQMFLTLPFFLFFFAKINIKALVLWACFSLSKALPIWSGLSVSCSPRRSKNFIVVVMVTHGCAPFTKTNCRVLKKERWSHISSRAFKDSMSTHQDRCCRKYNRHFHLSPYNMKNKLVIVLCIEIMRNMLFF